MFDIYDNLENYDEINSFEQLKTENKDLKFKLDEYKTALTRLQKEILQDFDNLSCQHQQLLANYSSLLKTARAEVERKTETITHINSEKDKIFLRLLSEKTIKGESKERSSVPPDKGPRKTNENRNPKTRKKCTSQDRTDSKLNLRDNLQCIPPHIESFRKDTPTGQDAISTRVSDDHPSMQRDATDLRMVLHNRGRNRDNQKLYDEPPHFSQAANQSGQAPHRQEYLKFSTEEEDTGSSTTRSIPPPRDDSDAHRHRVDDHYTQKPDPRDNDRARISREEMYAAEKQRNRFDVPYKYRDGRNRGRSYSGHRGRFDDMRYRDRSRPRDRESPPIDRHQRNKSRDRRFYDRERDYDDRHKPYDRPPKHKLRQEIEEFEYKRRKIEMERDEERYRREREFQEYVPNHPVGDFTSCQSPDEVYVEQQVAAHQPVREIMHTSQMPQEDPRKKSSRYIPVGEGDHKVWLSGSSTQLQLVKVGPWTDDRRVQKQHVPSRFSPEPFNPIYMDTDNPYSESVNSGDVNDLDIYSDILPNTDVDVGDKVNEYDVPVESQMNIETSKQIMPEIQCLDMANVKSIRTESIPKEPSTQSEDKVSSCVPIKPLELLLKQMSQDTFDETSDKDSSHKETIQTNPSQKLSSSGKIEKDKVIDTKINVKSVKHNLLLNTPAKKTLVAGDLELSEDSSDGNEVPTVVNKNIEVSTKTHHDTDKSNQKTKSKSHDEDQKKQVKPTKVETKTKEINAKFTDLFGESSLLMPEDLDLQPAQVESSCDYPPSPFPVLLCEETAKDACLEAKKSENVKKTSEKPKNTLDKAKKPSDKAKTTSDSKQATSESAKISSNSRNITSESAKVSSDSTKIKSDSAKIMSSNAIKTSDNVKKSSDNTKKTSKQSSKSKNDEKKPSEKKTDSKRSKKKNDKKEDKVVPVEKTKKPDDVANKDDRIESSKGVNTTGEELKIIPVADAKLETNDTISVLPTVSDVTTDHLIVNTDTKTEECIKIIPTPVSNEPDVYKTVIISTGQQQDSSSTSNTTNTDKSSDKSKSDAEITIQREMPKSVENATKSLENVTKSLETPPSFVTSTPERSIRNISLEYRSQNSVNSMSVSTQEDENNATSSQQNVPDVRVMLKRRKKRIVK